MRDRIFQDNEAVSDYSLIDKAARAPELRCAWFIDKLTSKVRMPA